MAKAHPARGAKPREVSPSRPLATLEATSLMAHIGRGHIFEEVKRQKPLPDTARTVGGNYQATFARSTWRMPNPKEYGEHPCRLRGAALPATGAHLPTTGSAPADPLAQGVGDQDAQSDWGRPRVCIIIHDNNIINYDNAHTMPRKVTSSRAIVGVGGESAPRKRCEAEGKLPLGADG